MQGEITMPIKEREREEESERGGERRERGRGVERSGGERREEGGERRGERRGGEGKNENIDIDHIFHFPFASFESCLSVSKKKGGAIL
jgi:hypothetical protein